MIDGANIRMGGRDWVVPPLNLRMVRRLRTDLEKLGGVSAGSNDEQLDVIVRVVHAALTRNYPDILLENVEEMLDLGNANDVILALMGISGLTQRGEAQEGSPSTGTTSTPTSPQPPGGPTPSSTT